MRIAQIPTALICRNPALVGEWFRSTGEAWNMNGHNSRNPALVGEWFRRAKTIDMIVAA